MPFEGREVAVDPNDRRLTELEMDVAGAEVDGLGENVVEAHPLALSADGAESFSRSSSIFLDGRSKRVSFLRSARGPSDTATLNGY